MKLIHDAEFVNLYQPRITKYNDDDLARVVHSFSKGICKINFTFDKCLENRIKSQTRDDRGKRMRILIRKDTPLCEDFNAGTRNNDNKTDVEKAS